MPKGGTPVWNPVPTGGRDAEKRTQLRRSQRRSAEDPVRSVRVSLLVDSGHHSIGGQLVATPRGVKSCGGRFLLDDRSGGIAVGGCAVPVLVLRQGAHGRRDGQWR